MIGFVTQNSEMAILINKLITLFLVLIVGYVGYKTKLIGDSVKDGSAQLITKITMPLLLFASVTALDLSGGMLVEGLTIYAISLVVVIVLYFVGIATGKLCKFNDPRLGCHALSTNMGNIVFLGFTLLQAMFGNVGLFYAIFFYLANDTFLWLFGAAMFHKHKTGKWSFSPKNLLNINLVTFVAAIVMLLLHLRLPSILHNSLHDLGGITVYLAMLFIGTVIASVPLGGILKKYSILWIVATKMIVVPLLVGVFLSKVFSFGLPHTAVVVISMQLAMPVMSSIAALAKDANSDYEYISESVFVTTLVTLVTLPAVYFILSMM